MATGEDGIAAMCRLCGRDRAVEKGRNPVPKETLSENIHKLTGNVQYTSSHRANYRHVPM